MKKKRNMEANNQNQDHLNFGMGSGSIDLRKTQLPEWLLSFFLQPKTYQCPDLNESLIEGYPIDDEF